MCFSFQNLVTFLTSDFLRLAEYVANEPDRLAAKAEAQRAKLEALERKLGIDSSSSKTSGDTSDNVSAGKKHRFDDTEYLEKTEELKEGVKNAVSIALLKKRKKTKLVHNSEEDKDESRNGKDEEDKKEKGTIAGEQDAVQTTKTTLLNARSITLDAIGA